MKIYKQRFVLYIYAVSLHILVVYVQCDWLVKCGDCKCKWNSGKKTADCKNMTISKIPQHLSSELQVLDLSFNKIIYIDDSSFINADLKNLHKLFMRNCSLENIHSQGLIGLEILIEIDLSNNLLKTLPGDVFASLVKVRSILLNNNLLETLEDGLFCNLKYLHKIELRDNLISYVGIDVFVNLPYLSQIFLSGNRLKFLRKETFEKLKRLASLSLESNPWNCTCELQLFRDFALKRNLYTPPTSCYYPQKLRGILWTDNQPEAFACKPKIIYPSRGASINTSKENVTLICRVHASPNTLIAWDYNKQMYSNNYQARVHIQLLREEIQDGVEKEIGRDIFISRLTIIGAEKSDEGTYTCLAENPGGKDEVQMNLLVQKHNHQNILFQNNLVIIICLMVLGLLSASIFLAMVTCCIYKRFKAINHLPSDEHQNQKRTYVGGLNVVNSVNDPYHHQNGETNYSDIKQNGNLDVGVTINNFTDLKDTNILYCENNSQGSLQEQQQHELHQHQNENYQQQKQQQQQQNEEDNQNRHRHQQQKHQQIKHQQQLLLEDQKHTQTTNCSTVPGHHHSKLEHSGAEYKPDLLPYVPQSMPFNKTNRYGYAVNQTTTIMPYESQQNFKHHHYHQHQPHRQLHQEDQIIDDLQYTNSYPSGDGGYNSQHEGDVIRSGSVGDEYLHYGITDTMPVGKMSVTPSTMTASATTLVTQPNQNQDQILRRGIYEDSPTEILGRQSIVRTSPSLNFLSNYYSRRELL